MTRPLTDLQRAALRRAARAELEHRAGFAATPYIRSLTAGERVTLASLEARGVLERRPWRGDGISRDSAFEYRLPAHLRETLRSRNRSRRSVKRLGDGNGGAGSPAPSPEVPA